MRRAPLLGTLLLLVAPLPSFGAGCEAFVGEWHWFTNHRVTIKADHSLLYDGQPSGRWECSNGQIAKLYWNAGFVDSIQVTGDQIFGKNQQGIQITASRNPAATSVQVPAPSSPSHSQSPTPSVAPAGTLPDPGLAPTVLSGPLPKLQSTPALPPGARLTSHGCIRRGEILDCPSPDKMTNIPGHPDPRQAPVADPEQVAMQIPANLSAQQLYDMAEKYEQEHKDAPAGGYFWKCANMNDSRCQTALGLMYLDGRGVPQDLRKAVAYVGRAANAGHSIAAYQEGVWYEDGDIFPMDMRKAMGWYMKSANQGFYRGQRRVGLAYEIGEVVPRNRQTAVYWLMQAAKQGDGQSHWIADWLMAPSTPPFASYDALWAYVNQKMTNYINCGATATQSCVPSSHRDHGVAGDSTSCAAMGGSWHNGSGVTPGRCN